MSETPVHVIYGATGGVGSELARHLAARGARLVLAGRRAEALDELRAELDATTVAFDAMDRGSVAAVVEQALAAHGRVDGLVNCVGTVLLKPAHLTRDEDWDETIALNLTSSFAALRAGAKAMMKTGGSIVLISSAAAEIGLSNHEAIAAAKGGVAAMARSAAATYAAKGIRINAVSPGLVQTRLTERVTRSEAGRKASLSMHAIGRLGEPADVAQVIGLLLSPEGSWITGQVFGVDGGLSRVRGRA